MICVQDWLVQTQFQVEEAEALEEDQEEVSLKEEVALESPLVAWQGVKIKINQILKLLQWLKNNLLQYRHQIQLDQQ